MMANNRNKNDGDTWGLWALLIIIVAMAAAVYHNLKHFDAPVAVELPVMLEVIPSQDGLIPYVLICFEKADGRIMWRRNVPMTDGGSVRYVNVPSIGETELIAGLCYNAVGDALVVSFELEENRLLPTDYEIKGNVLGAVNHFLSKAP